MRIDNLIAHRAFRRFVDCRAGRLHLRQQQQLRLWVMRVTSGSSPDSESDKLLLVLLLDIAACRSLDWFVGYEEQCSYSSSPTRARLHWKTTSCVRAKDWKTTSYRASHSILKRGKAWCHTSRQGRHHVASAHHSEHLRYGHWTLIGPTGG